MTQSKHTVWLWVFCGLLVSASGASFVQAGFLYVLNDVNGGPNQLYGYGVNEADGTLTLLSGFPMTTGGNGSQNLMCQRMCFDPAHARLYVINGGSNTLSAYSVNLDNGSLTPMPFSPLTLPPGPADPVNRWAWAAVAVHPSGSPLVVARDQLDQAVEPGQLASFVITASTAALSADSPCFVGNGVFPYALAFSRDGTSVYTGGNRATTLFAGFGVNATTGALNPLPGSPFTSDGHWPLAYATDGRGRLFMYSYHNQTVGQSEAYTLAAGVPTAVSGNPFVSGLDDGIFGIRHPAGYYMVVDRTYSRVGVFRITGAGAGTLLTAVAGSPFQAGGMGSTAMALSRAGTHLFVANTGHRNVTTFAVNPSTGVLTNLRTQPQNTLGAGGYLTGIAYAAPPLLGDLNLDGAVDAIDAELLARLLADSLVETEIPASWNGDMNADGLLDVLDLALLELFIGL
ncbi:MAG: beta-propeller fold lactonase family protein [Acidobacteria bacterium]|nr:beta-propeller fold lactonase family protein [Acidobacteriota bacterium]